MIAPDVNILLYAYDEVSEFHKPARDFWQTALSSPGPVGIPIQCLHAFLRIITHPGLRARRMPMPEALAILDEWLGLPQVRVLVPGNRHWPLMQKAIRESRAVGSFVSDVAISVTVMEHGATLYTTDRGFTRIPGLKWENPLLAR